MSKTPVGARVGAILSGNSTEVHLLGFGVYDGEHVPPFGPMGAPMEFINEMKQKGELPADWEFKNPRITLDDGRVVWGCQCWWGAEASIANDPRERVIVPLPDLLPDSAPISTPSEVPE